MLVPKLLLSTVKLRFFAQKRPNMAQNWHFWSFRARPCRLIWYPIDGLVGGCGARAVYRNTPIYFTIVDCSRSKKTIRHELTGMIRISGRATRPPPTPTPIPTVVPYRIAVR